jgi:hypothetical protein
LLACLLLPLGCILHVSIKCILNFTCADVDGFDLVVDLIELMTGRNKLSWMDRWW